MKKKKIDLLWLFLFVTFICLCMFMPNILSHRPVVYGTDLQPQQFFFNMEFINMMNGFFKEGTLPFYSWHMFLGTNFFSSQTYYTMGDVFVWLSLFLQNINFFDRALIMEIAKFFVSAFTMYGLLKEMKMSKMVRIFGSLCYSFSGWAVFYSGQLMFHTFYCFIPLYLWGIERYLKENRKMLFLFSTALLLITHWYLFYTLSFLTPFYYIYRYSLVKKDFSCFLKDTVKLIGVYFIGVLIAGAYMIPTVAYMMDSDRAGLQVEFLFKDPQVYLHLLASMFAPNYQYIYGVNVFETHWHVTREICLWAGGLTALLVSQIFWVKNKEYRKKTLILYGILVVMAVIPFFDSALHGFGDPSFRWTFFLILLNILTACHLLNEPELLDLNKLKISSWILFVFCIVIIPITGFISDCWKDWNSNFIEQMILFGVCGILLVVYGELLRKKKMKSLIILTVIEFSLSGCILYCNKMDKTDRGTYEFSERVTHVLQSEDNQLNNYLNAIAPGNYSEYYRVYVPHEEMYWNYSHNMSVAYQLNGLMTYNSTYSPSVAKLREMNDQASEFNSDMIFNIRSGDLMEFLNVKYALVYSEDELPEGVNWKLIQNDYLGNILIYENEDYRPLATTYNEVLTYDEYFDRHMTGKDLNHIVFCEPEDRESIKSMMKSDVSNGMIEIQYGGNQLTGLIQSDDQSFAVLTLPYDKGWKVVVNGQTVPTYNVNGGFIGFEVQSGANNIQMFFIPYGLKPGLLLSGTGIIMAAVLYFFDRKKRTGF